MPETSKKSSPLTVKRWVLPVLLLPMNALVFIPAIILWLADYHWAANHPSLLAIGGVLLFLGLALAGWTMWLFNSIGKGTAAPWDPPKHLVVAGPYRHVRNPMLTSVFIMQIAEALLLNSWAIFVFFAVFVIVNMFYFPLVEEKKLERRFGEAYREYCRNVPRLIPRPRPWPDEVAGP